MKRYLPVFLSILSGLLMIAVFSCKSSSKNYVTCYNRLNAIDSLLHIKKDYVRALRKYGRFFKSKPAVNRERLEEFRTYITLADHFKKNFGGKKTLHQLILLQAPYKNGYLKSLKIYNKYGLDSSVIKADIKQWQKSLIPVLVDSFSLAFKRNEMVADGDSLSIAVVNRKNAALLKWTLEKYGFPSVHKIGLFGNGGVFMPLDNFLGHMITSEHYPYFKKEVLKAVQSGDCPPRYYAAMVDKFQLAVAKKEVLYGAYLNFNTVLDTLAVNKNRRLIGMPTLEHAEYIRKSLSAKK